MMFMLAQRLETSVVIISITSVMAIMTTRRAMAIIAIVQLSTVLVVMLHLDDMAAYILGT